MLDIELLVVYYAFMDDKKEFSELLTEVMKEKGWNIQTVLERVPGTSRTTLSWWKNGRTKPTPLFQRLFIEELRRAK